MRITDTHATRDFFMTSPRLNLSSVNHTSVFVAVCPLRLFGVVTAASYAIFAYLLADRSLMLRPVLEFDFAFASLAVWETLLFWDPQKDMTLEKREGVPPKLALDYIEHVCNIKYVR